MENKSFKERFLAMKTELKVGKNVENSFGGFQYRTKPQIEELLKPLQIKYNIIVFTTSRLIDVAGRVFIEATAKAEDVFSDEHRVARANAEIQAKGGTKMSEPQLTGSSESYAGKYALGNLFGIDDNDDPDKLSGNPESPFIPTNEERAKINTTVGDKAKQTIVTFRTSIVQTPAEQVTLEFVNNALDKVATEFDNDVPAVTLINNKAKIAGFIYNENTKKWENK